MSEENCGNLILDAIDQLRKRKARPDLDRICHMLERRHNMSSTEVNEELGRLVKKGAVVKVDYKGSTSYRNAAKWARMKTHFFGSFYNSSDISTVVLEAVSTLTLPSQDQTQLKSASIHDIEQYLLKRDAQSNLNLATLQAVLEKEVLKKTIHRLPSGEFVPLLQNVSSDVSSPEKISNESLKKDSSSPLHKALATDLDDEDMEFDYWSDSYRCDYCLLTSSANRKGEPEALLRCRECNAKAHPSCMEYTLPEDKSVQDIYWKCPDCKTCSVCNGTYPGNCDDLLSCDMCHTDYHRTCHDPKVEIKSNGPWRCGKCEAQSGRFKFTPKKSRFSTSSFEDDIDTPFLRGSFLKSIEQYPVSIPYAHEWSIKNVEAFFNFIGFEEESKAFRDQEIDGLSLLLMKRDDVLTGLGIKLGPALKIYNHIKKLQGRVGEATCA